jgi:methylenetetrahydrofolate reductase (NADPH)
MRITLEIIEAVRKIDGVVGIHLMPVSSEQITPAVVERAGLYPRPQVEVQ